MEELSVLDSYNYLFHSRDKSLVLDIGAGYTKCGLAGQHAPKVIVPSIFLSASGSQISLLYPENVTEKQWQQALELFLREVLLKSMGIGSGYKVIVIESLLHPEKFRKALSFVLFKKFKMDVVKYCVAEAMPLFSLKPIEGVTLRNTGLIVDFGFRSRVLPVYQNIALLGKFTSGGVNATDLLLRLRALLQEHAQLLNTSTSQRNKTTPVQYSGKVLEDILTRCCFLCARGHSASQPPVLAYPPKSYSCLSASTRSDVETNELTTSKKEFSQRRATFSVQDECKRVDSIIFTLPDGKSQVEVNGYIRAHTADILFELTEYHHSLAATLLDTLLKCEVDIRVELASSIILSGGVCLLPGFISRFKEELEELLLLDEYASLKSLSGHFNIFSTQYPANTLSWVGGSVIGSLESGCFSVSAENYDLKRNVALPNWTLQILN